MTAGRSWLRLALRRLADEPALAGAAILVALVAATVAAACVVYPDTMLRRGLVAVLGAADPATSAVTVTTDVAPAAAGEVDAAVAAALRAALAPGDGPIVRTARSTSWQLPGGEGLAYPPLTVFAWDDGLAARTTLVEGAWPADGATDRVEAVVTTGAAEALRLEAGTVVEVASRLDPDRRMDVVISGIVRVLDAADPAWGADRLALDGTAQPGSFPLRGPLFVTRDALLDQVGGREVTLGWRAIPIADRIAPEDAVAIRDRVASLGARLERDLGTEDPMTIATGLTAVLDEAGAGIAASRSGVAIIALQLLVLAAYALVLLASLVAAQRRAATELAAARGAAASTVLGLAALEGLLVAIPAVVLGPFLAVVLVGLLTGSDGGPGPRLAPAAIALALAAGLVTVVATALPAAAALGPVARLRGRLAGRGTRSLGEQTGIDLALVTLAALGLWQLHENGPLIADAGGPAGDVDPLLAAAPAIGLLAGGLLALRIGPLVGAWLERPASTARGAVVALAGRGVARRAAEAGRAALLLVVATALVLFTAAYGRTWARSQVDQVAAAQAADLVGAAPTGAAAPPGWIVGDQLRGLPGVEEAIPASRATFTVGTAVTRGTLLAAPADAAARSVQVGRDAAGRTFADLVGGLAAERSAVPAVAVPAGATSLGLHVDAGLVAAPGADGSVRQIPGTWLGLVPSVVVRDGTGMLHRLPGAAGRLAGGEQVLEVSLEGATAGRPAQLLDPVDVVGVELEVLLPDGVAADGTIRLDRITAAGGAGAEEGSPVDLDLGPVKAGWSAARGAFGVPPEPLPVDPGSPLRIALGEPAEGPVPVVIALRATRPEPDTALPAIVDASAAAAIELVPGDVVPISRGPSDVVRVRVDGVVDLLPGVPPGAGGIFVDLPGLALSDYVVHGALADATEWWLGAASGADLAAAAAGAAGAGLDNVRVRATLLGDRQDDPLARGVLGALELAAGAALAIAGIGYAVAAWRAVRSRRFEVGIARALGLERGQATAWVASELAFGLAVGIGGGIVVGLVLAWAVLPSITVTPDGSTPAPPPVIVLPWDLVVVAIGAGVVAFGAMLLALRAPDGNREIAGLLREDRP